MDYDDITIHDLHKRITEISRIDETERIKLILLCHIAKGLSDIGNILNLWRGDDITKNCTEIRNDHSTKTKTMKYRKTFVGTDYEGNYIFAWVPSTELYEESE